MYLDYSPCNKILDLYNSFTDCNELFFEMALSSNEFRLTCSFSYSIISTKSVLSYRLKYLEFSDPHAYSSF